MQTKQRSPLIRSPRVGRIFLLRIDGHDNLVRGGLPEPGGLYFYNPNRRAEIIRRGLDPEHYAPQDGWELIWKAEERRRLIGTMLEKIGLDTYLNQGLVRRLNMPNQAVSIYRVPANAD